MEAVRQLLEHAVPNSAEQAPPPCYLIDREKLPVDYPTHASEPKFWEELGRTVATYGFLEEMLGKAIFALSGMKEFDPEADPEAFDDWIKLLSKTITDQLGQLILSYEKALAENDKTKGIDYSPLITKLKDAKDFRNTLCHGSWGKPDDKGRAIPRFVNRRHIRFETPLDVEHLKSSRAVVLNLVCDVMDSVTALGVQFPGSDGPGQVLWPKQMNLPKEAEGEAAA